MQQCPSAYAVEMLNTSTLAEQRQACGRGRGLHKEQSFPEVPGRAPPTLTVNGSGLPSAMPATRRASLRGLRRSADPRPRFVASAAARAIAHHLGAC